METEGSQLGFSLNLYSAAYTILYMMEISMGLNYFLRKNWMILLSFRRSFLSLE